MPLELLSEDELLDDDEPVELPPEVLPELVLDEPELWPDDEPLLPDDEPLLPEDEPLWLDDGPPAVEPDPLWLDDGPPWPDDDDPRPEEPEPLLDEPEPPLPEPVCGRAKANAALGAPTSRATLTNPEAAASRRCSVTAAHLHPGRNRRIVPQFRLVVFAVPLI